MLRSSNLVRIYPIFRAQDNIYSVFALFLEIVTRNVTRNKKWITRT